MIDLALSANQPKFPIPVLQNNKTIDLTLRGKENFYNNSLRMNIGKYFSKVKVEGFKAHYSRDSEAYTMPNTYVNITDAGIKIPLGKHLKVTTV